MTFPPVITTDAELAALLAASPRPAGPCSILTPSCSGTLAGRVLALTPLVPVLPAELAPWLPLPHVPAMPPMPGLADFEADFEAAAASPALAGMPLASPAQFARRLATCRACPWWREPAHCDHPESTCSRRHPYLAACQCPASKWPLH